MTLTEFLLARIAEDEAVAREREDDDLWREGAYGWTGTYPTGDPVVLQVDPARVLAECEAKRRIVELNYFNDNSDDYSQGAEVAHDDVLRLLALPYADHPDFREEWKL